MTNAEIAEILGVEIEDLVANASEILSDVLDANAGLYESGVKIFSDEPKAPVAKPKAKRKPKASVVLEPKADEPDDAVKPKAEKCLCKVCGFYKKARRVNAEGICKMCYLTLATCDGETVTVVGKMGKKGHNTVSIVVGGERMKVTRKARLEA